MKKTFNFLFVVLISLMVLVSGCGKPKEMTFATYKSNWNSIVKEKVEKHRISLPESSLKLPDDKPHKGNTGALVYKIPFVNITQTKNFLLAEVDESDRIRSIALHALISDMSIADANDDFNHAIQLVTLTISSMKAPDVDKAYQILLGASKSGTIKPDLFLGRNRTYTDENGNEYLFNSTEGGLITLIIKTKLESKNAKKNAVPQDARETEKNRQTSGPGNNQQSYVVNSAPQVKKQKMFNPVDTPQSVAIMKGVSGASSSSSLKEGDIVYSASNIVDGNGHTCWADGVAGLGVGESITINFNQKYNISGFRIFNGYQKSQDLFNKNSRPAALRVIGSDGTNEVYNITDSFYEQDIYFDKMISVDRIKLVIERVARGNKYEDTCISEVIFF